MRIFFKQIKTLPVITESGANLGRVIDIELDANNHSVGKYVVSAWPTILKRERLFIAPDQIVSIDAEKIIIKDGAVKIAETKPAFATQSIKEAAVNAEMRD